MLDTIVVVNEPWVSWYLTSQIKCIINALIRCSVEYMSLVKINMNIIWLYYQYEYHMASLSIWISYGFNMNIIWLYYQYEYHMASIWISYGFIINMNIIWLYYQYEYHMALLSIWISYGFIINMNIIWLYLIFKSTNIIQIMLFYEHAFYLLK